MMSTALVVLVILVVRLRTRMAVLAVTLLVLTNSHPIAQGYEFCDDISQRIVTAITIDNYCPMRFRYTEFRPELVVSPDRLESGLLSWHDDCASAPSGLNCHCFDRLRSSLSRYFFTVHSQPLFAEEITICAINHVFLAPAPVSMIQMDPILCNVTYVPERRFTIINNGYEFCCLFKIVGTGYFWHSPGCSKQRLVSCVTRSSSQVSAWYDIPIACMTKNVYIKVGLARRIAFDKSQPTTACMSTPIQSSLQTAQIQWRPFLGFVPFTLLIMVLITVYSCFRYKYLFQLDADSVP